MLVATVLLQPGKTDAGALFTSNISSTAFGPRGTTSILARITIVAAAVFMVSAFMISLPVFQGGISVLQTVTESPAEPALEAAPAVTDVNANTQRPETNANTQPADSNVSVPAANTEPTANSSASKAEEQGEEPAANN